MVPGGGQLQPFGGGLRPGDGEDHPGPGRHRHHLHPGDAGSVFFGRRQVRQGHFGFQPDQAGDADGGTGGPADSKCAEPL